MDGMGVVGDLFGSGTISGPEKGTRGCFLELTWSGTEPVTLDDGSERLEFEDEQPLADAVAATGLPHVQYPGVAMYFGGVGAAMLDANDGLEAAGDPRREAATGVG